MLNAKPSANKNVSAEVALDAGNGIKPELNYGCKRRMHTQYIWYGIQGQTIDRMGL